MATDTSICNSALSKLGAERILSLDENAPNARLCKEQYPKIVDALLRGHPWNFAIKRAQLAASTTDPVFGYDYSFPLPSDCLRVLEIEDGETVDWQKEGRTIVTDSDSMKIKYISSDVTPGEFDANFAEVVAIQLAHDICFAVTQSTSLKETLADELKKALSHARTFDSQEGYPRQAYAKDWRNARY